MIALLSGEFALVNPSSEMYPSVSNAASKSVLAFVGRVVPAGAVETAPPIFGLAAVTFDADAVVIFFPPVDSVFCLLASVVKTTPPF
ncbi:Uncharacterised protein [Streptococcus pneumoniae]|nr:Uncharacterised protein [Streptococcus pneumoniae]